MEENPKKPAKPRRAKELILRRTVVFAVVRVAILVLLLILCGALKRMGRLHEGECIWVQDLCGVITDVSMALLKGTPIDEPEPVTANR